MPAPSTRISTLTEDGDDGWAVFYRARAMKAAGREVLELTIGEHDIGTSPEILDEMHRAAQAGHTGYAEVAGIAALRAAVAERLTARHGVRYGAGNILIVPGAQAGLFAAHHATCDEGDRALLIDPYYTTYPGTIRAVGARPHAVAARSRDGFQPDLAALASAAPGARSLLINSPNNPTGAVYTLQSLEGIARIAEDHDLWVISDEVYDTQVWTGRHIPFASLTGMVARTLTVGSLSKSHAMTGSRLGWVAGPEAVIARLITLATHTTYGVPGYIQEAGVFALRQGAAAEAGIAAPFLRRRQMVLDRIAAQNRVRAIPPGGAMYVMLDIRATGLSGTEFATRLLEDTGVAVMPGESFGRAAAGHLRVALTLPDREFGAAIDRMIAFAARLCETAAVDAKTS
jgi:arginine:pyruvate transaminase